MDEVIKSAPFTARQADSRYSGNKRAIAPKVERQT